MNWSRDRDRENVKRRRSWLVAGKLLLERPHRLLLQHLKDCEHPRTHGDLRLAEKENECLRLVRLMGVLRDQGGVQSIMPDTNDRLLMINLHLANLHVQPHQRQVLQRLQQHPRLDDIFRLEQEEQVISSFRGFCLNFGK